MEHKAVSMGVVAGAEHEAASMDGQEALPRDEVEHKAATMGRQQARSMR
jgi:hypothetical protein